MYTPKLWVWESATWPELSYDRDALAPLLNRARACEGRLMGKADAIGTNELSYIQRDVWAGEAVATAAIEGETLDLADVRLSVTRRLGLAAASVPAVPRHVDGLLDVMEDAAANWQTDLTEERLCRWQAALFPGSHSSLRDVEIGRYRSHAEAMQIVSGPIGKAVVHYEAPPSAAVRAEMRNFLDWFNGTRRSNTVDGILRAGFAHVRFETIHPFGDGNGRVGRAVVDMAIAQDARQPFRLHGVSMEIRRRQDAYYDALNRAQRGTGDVTDWLTWFVEVFCESCQSSSRLIDEALVRARFWSQHKNVEINERQRKVLNRMLDRGPGNFEGGMTPRKYLALTGIKSITASRDLADLVTKAMLVREGAGRSTYYNLAIPGWGWVPKLGQADPGRDGKESPLKEGAD